MDDLTALATPPKGWKRLPAYEVKKRLWAMGTGHLLRQMLAGAVEWEQAARTAVVFERERERMDWGSDWMGVGQRPF